MVKKLQTLLSDRKRFFTILSLLIVSFAFVVRIVRIGFPSSFYFDEVYHAFTATTFLHNDPKGYEYWQTPPAGVAYEWTHPPLAKLFMAGGMVIFGENSVGWRISSVLFGTAVIALAGLLSYQLFGSRKITLFTLGILALDNLLLTMSRIAMNDMHFLAFALASCCCFVEMHKILFDKTKTKQTTRWLLLCALFMGLSLASKWTALYVGIALVIATIARIIIARKLPPLRVIIAVIGAALIVPLLYLASYSQFFLQGHTLTQWKETTQQMWWYHTNLRATHAYQSRPWQWILDLRPVWMHVDYTKNDQDILANIYNTDNPFLLWSGLAAAIGSLGFVAMIKGKAMLAHKKMTKSQIQLLAGLGFTLLLYGMLWIPWLASPRIMFFYHYAPAVPFLSILLAFCLERLYRHRAIGQPLVWGMGILLIVGFIALFPLSTGLFVPRLYTQTLFSIMPSWQ